MPRGSKPQPPGEADQRSTTHKWNMAEVEGWQHGRKPAPPRGLTDEGKKAWRTWIGAWWACFYTPDDIPGLELTVLLYDKALRGDIDISKVTPLLDRYGITPKGRQDLRWARREEKSAARAAATSPDDQLAARRAERERAIS